MSHINVKKDYIVIGSDSGRISIIEFNPEKCTLDRVHCETFGKSGNDSRIEFGVHESFSTISAR